MNNKQLAALVLTPVLTYIIMVLGNIPDWSFASFRLCLIMGITGGLLGYILGDDDDGNAV